MWFEVVEKQDLDDARFVSTGDRPHIEVNPARNPAHPRQGTSTSHGAAPRPGHGPQPALPAAHEPQMALHRNLPCHKIGPRHAAPYPTVGVAASAIHKRSVHP